HDHGQVDHGGPQHAAVADPPHIAHAEQAGPHIRATPDGDASLGLGMLETVTAQKHDVFLHQVVAPGEPACVDRTRARTYIFAMAIQRIGLPTGVLGAVPAGQRQPASVTELNERAREVLHLVVESYVETGEPVGSRALTRKITEALSPATIRNIMADLQDLGLLYAPHTSAGRLPTQAGLAPCVDRLLEGRPQYR